jgi:hypothetical protein
VALSVRQWQSFPRKVSSLARNAAGSAASSCSVQASHQEACRFIRFTSLNPRGGTRGSMVKPIAREAAMPNDSCALRLPNVRWQLISVRRPRKPATRLNLQGEISSVGSTCTRVSNASACICLSLHPGDSVPHMRNSCVLSGSSMQRVPSG